MKLELRVLPGVFAVCRLAPDADVPGLLRHTTASPPVPADGFLSVTRTQDEVSVVCAEDAVPAGAEVQRGWRGLQVVGPLDFALTGIAAALTAPLADAGVSVLPIATYDTDYLFVREEALAAAVEALEGAGHTVGTDS